MTDPEDEMDGPDDRLDGSERRDDHLERENEQLPERLAALEAAVTDEADGSSAAGGNRARADTSPVPTTGGGRPTKVIGRLSDADGIGVLGEATASTSQTYGVKGATNSPAGYGIYTPDDARIEGRLDTNATDFLVETGTQSTPNARNVVMGHASNGVEAGVEGASITGGGYDDGGTVKTNTVYDDYCVVGGGYDNQAGFDDGDTTTNGFATVAGGNGNVASGAAATVGGGAGNTATSNRATVGGGLGNDATKKFATVPGGRSNLAAGQYSLAAGREAEAKHDGAFVWADSDVSTFSSTGTDQFLVTAAGGVGIGTDSPATQLHVRDSVSGTASVSNHVAVVENASSAGSADVLALQVGEDLSNVGNENNFVSFKDKDGDAMGAIEGDGSGGVTTASTGSDYAEYLPRLDPAEDIGAAEVVGVVDGAVTRRTDEATQALVVSDEAVVTGNVPGDDPQDRADHEVCAFVGQVPTRVRRPVTEGNLVVPSGNHDGTARAVAPAAYRPGDGPIVGRAWESDDADGVTEVTVAVGLETGEAVEAAISHHRDRIETLEAENDALRADVAALEAEARSLRVAKDRLDGRLSNIEDRLTASDPAGDAPAPADD